MESVEEIEKHISVANSIARGFDAMKKYENDPHTDKTGYGFNLDKRFCACTGITLHVDSWSGTYGDSSCSRIVQFDEKIFNKHLKKVLKADFKNIMCKVEESIRKEALTMKDSAVSELEKKLERIEKL